jgi:hypothetical protein
VSRPRTISNGPRPAGKNHKYHISSHQTRVHGLGPWDSNSLPRWKIPPDAMNCALIAVLTLFSFRSIRQSCAAEDFAYGVAV